MSKNPTGFGLWGGRAEEEKKSGFQVCADGCGRGERVSDRRGEVAA